VTRSQSLALQLAATCLALTALFVGVPSMVFSTNQPEFSWPFMNLLARYLPWALAIAICAILPVLLLPARLARWWAALCTVAAVYCWAHGVFQFRSFGAVGATSWSLNIPAWQVLAEALIIAVAVVPTWLLAVYRPTISAVLAVFLAVGMGIQAWPVMSASGWREVRSAGDRLGELASFSTEKNVLVILLDTLTSEVFDDVVLSSPELKSAFDGFLSFSDMSGAAPTTYLSMPTLHSGEIYDNSEVLGKFFDRAVGHKSVLTKIANAGYKSILVNSVRQICPDKLICYDQYSVIGGDEISVRQNAAKLMDMTLFRIVPLGLRNWAYDDGKWRFQAGSGDGEVASESALGNVVLGELARRTSANSAMPTLKFLHLMNTHPPTVFDRDCRYVGKELPASHENYEIQSECALSKVAQVLASLKRANVYDNTAVLVIADHGNYQLSSRRTETPLASKIISSAMPTFAVKPIGARGEMRRMPGEFYIGDFGATICDLTKDCVTPNGVSVLSGPPGVRTRPFNYYVWKHEYWDAEHISELVRVDLHGPVASLDSGWSALAAPVDIDELVSFGNGGTSDRYAFYGWSGSENWGTWTDGPSAGLWFRLAEAGMASQPLKLTFSAQAYMAETDPLRVKVLIDGIYATDILFPDSKPHTFELPIPPRDADKDAIRVEFQILNPRSPKELGRGDDARKLGMGFFWLRLSRDTLPQVH